MREILFRGKRIDNGEWAEGYYAKAKHIISEKEMHIIFPLDLGIFPHSEFSSYEEVDPATIGQQWISVEDRLPEETEEVLWFDGGRMEIGCVFRSRGVTFVSTCHGISPIDEYTHWTPLPAPPKEN